MRQLAILLFLICIFLPVYAQDDENAPALPTPLPRVYTQEEINNLMDLIQENYGIGFAYPAEWIASDANEVIWFTDGLHEILHALDTAAYYLYIYGSATDEVTPAEFFRQHFDRARIILDRATYIDGGFWGNTLPMYENSQVVGYMIQLTFQGMGGPFVIVHELGHVLDSLLSDVPHTQFVEELGGEWTTQNWIPGAGYSGNERFFPRGLGGPNEDFADTFANMLLGYLSEENIPVRFDFMQSYLPTWLESIREMPVS
ncbi:MAG: hypothetical protein KJ064_26300 [Anaerolineae bacterium]|nr:hypothetical protein [Anaerolineae bacterium]